MSDNRGSDAITGVGLFLALLICAPFFMYKTLSPTQALAIEIYETSVQILDVYEGRYPEAANWGAIQKNLRTGRDHFVKQVHDNIDGKGWWPLLRHFQFIWTTLLSHDLREGLVGGLINDGVIPKELPNIYAEASK